MDGRSLETALGWVCTSSKGGQKWMVRNKVQYFLYIFIKTYKRNKNYQRLIKFLKSRYQLKGTFCSESIFKRAYNEPMRR